MNCPNCKSTVSAAAKFCTNCGTKINQQTSTSTPAQATPKPATQSIKPAVATSGTTYCNVCGEPIIGKSCRTCESTASVTGNVTPSTTGQISRPTSGSGISNKTQQTPTSNQKKCPKCGTLCSLRVCTSCGEKLDQPSSSSTLSSSSSSSGSRSRPSSTSIPTPIKVTTPTPVSPAKNADNSNSSSSYKPQQTTTTPHRATISTPSPSSTSTTSKTTLSSSTSTAPISNSSASSTASSQRKCPNCSTLNSTRFCTVCGAKIEDSSSIAAKPTKEEPPAKQSVAPPPPKQTAPPAIQPTQAVPPPPPKQTTPPPPPTKQTIPPPPPKQTVPPPPPPKQTGAPVSPRGPGQGIPPPPPKNTIPPPPPAKKAIPPPPSTPKPSTPNVSEDPKLKLLMEENERLKKQLDDMMKQQLKEAQNQPQTSFIEEPATEPTEPAAERSWKKKASQPKAQTDRMIGLRESSENLLASSSDLNASNTSDGPEDQSQKHRSWKKKYETMKSTPNNAGETPTRKTTSSGGTVRHKSFTDSSLPPRERVVREIIDTEIDYVADLETIVNVFLTPLRKEQITTPEELIGIFSNVEYILAVNKQLLEDLQTNGGKNIGTVFLKKKDYLRVYSTYCSNQQASHDIMQRLLKKEKDKKFESFLQYTYARPECQGLDLGSFMIKPIQRICKYPLLMKELLKQTEPTHEEYQQTKDALQAIEDLLSQINEKKRDAESVQKVIELTKTLIGADGHKLVEPTRRYIKEGELSHYTHNKKEKEGYYFLFNDVFIYAKKKGSKFKLLAFISLKTADIRVTVTYEKPTFEVINTENNSVWPLILNSQDQVVSFMGELQTLMDKEQSRGSLRQSLKTQKLDDTITFECEYTEKRTVQMNRDKFTYEDLYYAIADQFGVQAITIMYSGRYIGCQQDVDSILAEGKSFYNFLIYDYYDYSNGNGETQ